MGVIYELENITKESDILIKKWVDLVGESEDSERFYDDFLGFFEECLNDKLDTSKESADALVIFFNKVRDIIGDNRFFNTNGKIFTEVLKEPILERLKEKGVCEYSYIETINNFFNTVTAKMIKDYIEKRDKLQETMTDELINREAPVSEIEDGVLLIVLVGILDSNRVMRIIDIILTKMEQVDSDYVIIDISNIADINTEIANQIMKLSNSIHYMGGQAYISGINSNIAKRLTHLAISLGDLKTFRDVKYTLKEIRQAKLQTATKIKNAQNNVSF